MNTLPIRTCVRNAAAVFSGVFGAVARQAQQAGCSRQTVYQHARQVEQRLDPAARQAEIHQLRAENHALRQQLAAAGPLLRCDSAKLRQVATVAFAAGVSLRQIEILLKTWLPQGRAPDHSTIGRWVAAGARQAGAILRVLDAASVPHVTTIAADEVFFGGGRPWWPSSQPA